MLELAMVASPAQMAHHHCFPSLLRHLHHGGTLVVNRFLLHSGMHQLGIHLGTHHAVDASCRSSDRPMRKAAACCEDWTGLGWRPRTGDVTVRICRCLSACRCLFPQGLLSRPVWERR